MSVTRHSVAKMENPSGLPILPHLWRQIPFRIGDYSETLSSLYLRQARQSLNVGYCMWIRKFVSFHRMQSRDDLKNGEKKIEAFLTHLVLGEERVVSPLDELEL